VSADLNQPERLRWEADLVARARAGERVAFAELYRAYAPALLSRVLLPKLGNREAAEERLDAFEARGVSLFFWLSRIATNKALDMHRARATTGRALASFESLLAPLGEGPPDPGELFELRSDAVRVQKAVTSVLERLNARYRRAIELRFVEELPREECALALEVKIGTFDVLLLRALKAFRKEWTEVVGEKEVESEA
jgi:RNA polymerase sigma-70 factor (ECF subfamily)